MGLGPPWVYCPPGGPSGTVHTSVFLMCFLIVLYYISISGGISTTTCGGRVLFPYKEVFCDVQIWLWWIAYLYLYIVLIFDG